MSKSTTRTAPAAATTKGATATDDARKARTLPGTRTLVVGALAWGAYAALVYLLVLFTATYVIPVTGVFLARTSGVTAASPTNALLATWLLPLGFISAMLAAGQWALFKKMWRSTARLVRALGGAGARD